MLCYSTDMTYLPANMKGHGRSVEASAKACQERCAATLNCSYFSFWPDGGCHLQNSSATLVPGEQATSGPSVCPAGTEPNDNIESCWQLNVRYTPTGQNRSVENNTQGCHMRCATTPGCFTFSYWPDGGCHLQNASAIPVYG